MGKKKKNTMELRFYEIPQNEYVLALLGESWIRDYGQKEPGLHFHNLMEIGYCRNGTGQLVLDDRQLPYQPAMLSIIPHNYPHVTQSDAEKGPSYWEYLFLNVEQIAAELYPGDELYQRGVSEILNRKAVFIHEWENRNLILLVKMIMEEMREKRLHYRESVKGLMFALVAEILRFSESNEEKEKRVTVSGRNTGIAQIRPALDYVRIEYMHMLRVEELAQACHMSETHFRRVFEAYMNMSPVDYINLVRVQKACDLMKKTNDAMDIVAQKVGFSTTSTFNRNFKKYLSTSPYQWKINPENYEQKLLNYNISALKGW